MSEYEVYVKGLRQLTAVKPALDAKIAEASAARRAAEARAAQRHGDTISRLDRLAASAQGQVDRARTVLESAGLAGRLRDPESPSGDAEAPGSADLNTAFAAQRAAVDELEAAVRDYRSAPRPERPAPRWRRSRRRARTFAAAVVLAVAVLVTVIILIG